jgi:hypothetical protein
MKALMPVTISLTLLLAFAAGQGAFAQEPGAAAETAATGEAVGTAETAATAETAGTAETALWEKGAEEEVCCPVDGEDRVIFGENLVITEDETVEGDAVCIGGNLTVMGKVVGDAVSVGGNVTVTSTAVVDGDVVSIGGLLDVSPGAEVSGDKVAIEGEVPGLKGLKWLGVMRDVTGGLTSRIVDVVKELVFFGFLMLIALLLTAFMPRQFGRIDEHLAGDFPRSTLLGVGIMILLPVTLVILLVSIIGIPLIPLLILAAIVSILVGYVAMGRVLGHRLVGDKHVMFQVFIGLILLNGASLLGDIIALPGGVMATIGGVFTGVGRIIFIAASGIGMGAFVYSSFGRRSLAETAAAREAKKNGGNAKPAPPAEK